jgi:PAS domain S-box-containing protein
MALDQERVVRKISSLRQFNELCIREHLGNDGIIMVDEEGKVAYADAKSQILLGLSSLQLLGHPLSAFLAPESTESTAELLSAHRLPEKRNRCEVVFLDREKTKVPAMVSSTRLYRRGEPVGSLLVVVDLRNRQELVEDLKHIQSRLRHSSMELNKKLWELSVIKEVAHTLQTTLNRDEMLRIILTGVTAEQGLGFNRAFLLLLDEETSRLKGELAVGPSSHREAEWIWESLRSQPYTLKELLERHRDASGQFDPGLNEVVKKMDFDLIPDAGIMGRCILEGKNYNITDASKNPHVDGRLLELLGTEAFALVPLIGRGKPLGAMIADNRFTRRPIQDADVDLLETLANHASLAIERAHLYDQLTQKVQELEQAYRNLKESQDQLLRAERLSVVGKMATRLAHEMRNPIVSLGGFARLMAKKLPREEPNQEYLSIITEEVARLEKLLTEVLDFARPIRPSLETVDLNEVIQRVVVMMQPEIDARKTTAHMNLHADLPVLSLDPLQISQVMQNIIRNALEAMPSGGDLYVRTRSLSDHLRVEIEDTGVGIPQEHMGKLFSEFFTTKSEGVGLGLAVAYQTIHNHGGTIDVNSQEGKGSTFRIDLPMVQQMEGNGAAQKKI